MRAKNDHNPSSRMLALENTHNRGGGSVWPLARFQAVVKAARERGLVVHLDGARLFNAQIASGVAVGEYGKAVDTVSICFSKGLGAPVGSALCGSEDVVTEGRRLRKRLGGGMRQAGILAAGALYALAHNVDRLAEDHRSARRLAEGLAALPGVTVDLTRVETNMVFAEFSRPASETVARLKNVGVLTNAEGSKPNMLRFVTHLDVTLAEMDEVVARARTLFA